MGMIEKEEKNYAASGNDSDLSQRNETRAMKQQDNEQNYSASHFKQLWIIFPNNTGE